MSVTIFFVLKFEILRFDLVFLGVRPVRGSTRAGAGRGAGTGAGAGIGTLVGLSVGLTKGDAVVGLAEGDAVGTHVGYL